MKLTIYSVYRFVLAWLLFSVGLWRVYGKLDLKRWTAMIPGVRYLEWGKRVESRREAVLCCVAELILAANSFVVYARIGDRTQTGLALVTLVLTVFLIACRIRLFLRLLTVFGRRSRWVLLWLIADWLMLLIAGFGKEWQPKDVRFTEDWEAGTAPAEIEGAGAAGGRAPSESGLSVDLRERTVKEHGEKRYLLKDISLEIPNGSMVLLLGGSGAGKTTLVNAIIGYEKADAVVTLNGSDIYKEYARMKYRIGFVPQKNLIRGSDTVRRTIGDAAELRLPKAVSGSERKTRMEEVMDLLGLTAGADGLVSKKSGGQLRRVSIAMELVSDPELFVLDEPDSGLDGAIAKEIFGKLRAIADDGRIVIAITHTPDRVIGLFDKVIVLARDSGRVGRLAFYGSPQEARAFFGRETMEDIVVSVNRKEEGGDGLADEFVARYAALAAAAEGGGAA